MRGIARHQSQQEVAPAANHVALPHLRPGGHELLEAGQHSVFLAVETNNREESDLPAELLGVWVGVVAADDAGFFQRADPAQAGRRGNTRSAR